MLSLNLLFSKELMLSQTGPCFETCAVQLPLENTVGKEEMARIEPFLLFPPCFLPFWRTLCLNFVV